MARSTQKIVMSGTVDSEGTTKEEVYQDLRATFLEAAATGVWPVGWEYELTEIP